MTNNDIQKLLHVLKPDNFRTSDPILELYKLANSIQDLFSKAHTAITTVTDPKFKGEVIGTLIPWPGHFPLELDYTDTSLNDILVRGTSISDLTVFIHSIFSPLPPNSPLRLTLSSIHKSKGLEWPTVFLLGRNAWMPSKFATLPWMQEQEANLTYVAITRAKENLIEVIVEEKE